MPKWNGGVIGPANTPTSEVASGVWSLAEVEQYTGAGTWPVYVSGDPYFPYTTLLLHGDGTNGAQNNTFIDSSTNNFTITRNGNTTQGSFSPFSQTGWSNYFDGSGDYLSVNHSSSNSIAGNFTFECWANYPSDTPANGTILGWRSGSSGWSGFVLQRNNSSNLVLSVNSGGITITQTSATYTPNVWHHVAVTRSGSTVTLWVDGVSVGTSTLSGTISPGTGFTLGVDPFNIVSGTYFKGYISNARFVNGTAVYTTAFAPPTAPLTAITNTTVLTSQSYGFKDNSSNNFAITVNGNTAVQPFSPFAPSAAYSTATVGGSAYFDQTGDYLQTPASSMTALIGTANLQSGANLTIEGWVYITSLHTSSSVPVFLGDMDPSGGAIYWGFGPTSLNKLQLYWYDGSAKTCTGDSTMAINSWNHIAVSISSGAISLYVNGRKETLTGTTSTTNTSGSTGRIAINQFGGGGTQYSEKGYFCDVRIVKSPVYTATFVPPTAPLTAIANTSLLLNFTNGGIFDSTAKNVLETVGNAQISTSVKKFGTGSMYFDGTGDMVQMPPGPNFIFGTGDFTIEGWAYATSLEGGFGSIIYCQAGSGVNYLVVVVSPGGIVQCVINNAAGVDSTSTISLNTWFHFAVVRSSGSLKVYLNGVGGTAASRTTDLTNTTYIPALGKYQHAEANTWRGYIDDFRITKYARYTSNFTPPTEAFSDY